MRFFKVSLHLATIWFSLIIAGLGIESFFSMPTSDYPDVVVEVGLSLHCPAQHCPQYVLDMLLLLHCPIEECFGGESNLNNL